MKVSPVDLNLSTSYFLNHVRDERHSSTVCHSWWMASLQPFGSVGFPSPSDCLPSRNFEVYCDRDFGGKFLFSAE